ncbi:hypothetical protein HmCms148_02316 [Escherichia coli]|nr:hypothetical protein A13I_05153 [Escherichia coli KTE186]GCT41223.1 hypothetical protein HmCms148_02316 [Escherichia coli]
MAMLFYWFFYVFILLFYSVFIISINIFQSIFPNARCSAHIGITSGNNIFD